MEKQVVNPQKKILIAILYVTAIAIVLLGASFCIYSFVYNVQLPVLSSNIPGAVFGLVILFLGVRYVFSIQKLKAEVYRTTSSFSWGHFRNSKQG